MSFHTRRRRNAATGLEPLLGSPTLGKRPPAPPSTRPAMPRDEEGEGSTAESLPSTVSSPPTPRSADHQSSTSVQSDASEAAVLSTVPPVRRVGKVAALHSSPRPSRLELAALTSAVVPTDGSSDTDPTTIRHILALRGAIRARLQLTQAMGRSDLAPARTASGADITEPHNHDDHTACESASDHESDTQSVPAIGASRDPSLLDWAVTHDGSPPRPVRPTRWSTGHLSAADSSTQRFALPAQRRMRAALNLATVTDDPSGASLTHPSLLLVDDNNDLRHANTEGVTTVEASGQHAQAGTMAEESETVVTPMHDASEPSDADMRIDGLEPPPHADGDDDDGDEQDVILPDGRQMRRLSIASDVRSRWSADHDGDVVCSSRVPFRTTPIRRVSVEVHFAFPRDEDVFSPRPPERPVEASSNHAAQQPSLRSMRSKRNLVPLRTPQDSAEDALFTPMRPAGQVPSYLATAPAASRSRPRFRFNQVGDDDDDDDDEEDESAQRRRPSLPAQSARSMPTAARSNPQPAPTPIHTTERPGFFRGLLAAAASSFSRTPTPVTAPWPAQTRSRSLGDVRSTSAPRAAGVLARAGASLFGR